MAPRLYPPREERALMQSLLLTHLEEKPAELTAGGLIDTVMANGGSESGVDQDELTIELSRLIGSRIHMNPNWTLIRASD